DACRAGHVRWAEAPLVLLDVPLDSRVEFEFVKVLASRSKQVLATMPDGDDAAREALDDLGATIESLPDVAPQVGDLFNLRRYVFTIDRPAPRERTGDVRLFSAPAEGRETVEIVKAVLREA